MAAAKCNISFVIDYTSSKPITGATASYKIHGSGNPPVIYNITPLPTSGSTVNLPEIQASGNYDLTVELTTADGVATKTSSFKIGNCSFLYMMKTPLSKSINFTALGSQGEAFTFSELCQNIINSSGNQTVGLKFYSIPDRGTLTDQGWDIPVGYTITKAQIDAGAFEFWAKGSNGNQPNGTYSTTFTFKGVDVVGNESNLVVFTINANDISGPSSGSGSGSSSGSGSGSSSNSGSGSGSSGGSSTSGSESGGSSSGSDGPASDAY